MLYKFAVQPMKTNSWTAVMCGRSAHNVISLEGVLAGRGSGGALLGDCRITYMWQVLCTEWRCCLCGYSTEWRCSWYGYSTM